jgi:heme/copper-type cytochrome/quinol oxidase subunit 2
MLRFFKIYFWQLLKIVLALLGIFICLCLPLYVYAAQSHALPKLMLKILLVLLPLAGFLAGVAAPFLIEYRGRLTVRSFLGETLFMLIAFVFVGGGIFLGVAAGVKGVESFVHHDGTGLVVLFFLLSGAITGAIPGAILGALAITIWKFRRNGKRDLSPVLSERVLK